MRDDTRDGLGARLDALVRDLRTAFVGTAGKQYGDRLRRIAREHGDVNPFGDGDSKTAAPGTYAPVRVRDGVGSTCPSKCPYFGRCYATQGNVSSHEKRSLAGAWPKLAAAAAALTWGEATARVVRLHVSGDLMSGDRFDVQYVYGLRHLGRAFGGHGERTVAWTYTHAPDDVRTRVVCQVLRASGVHVRQSDHWGAGGAVVARFKEVARLKRETGLPLVCCPAQLSKDVTCQRCKLCWTRPASVIVFEPHGGNAATIAGLAPGPRRDRRGRFMRRLK